jgi:phenylalanyl-tRNA synthetase beta chain
MKVPMKWLREVVDTGLSAKDLAYRMTMAGLEAEKIEQIGSLWDNVYVGYVNRVERHPNADRLVLADIEAGEHKLTVVTGAPNIAQGQKVALALAGARLYDGHSDSPELKTLKPGMIRGVKSEGMACSEKELGLSEEHEGILVLAADAPVGSPLKDYLGDTVIEFEITPNLAHAFSIVGIAREASALTHAELHRPPAVDLATYPLAPDDLVCVEASDVASRYVGVVIENLTVGPTPDWMVRRLAAAGIRSINNIVDVTNYVMHELGQPLHAFDLDTLEGRRIVVRQARPGEQLKTLDHVLRTLTDDMLVIADAERPVGLAGVIGGFSSEVSDTTTSIILESANFDMSSVRQTARALRLRTDASARFERGLDPNLASDGAARAVQLILELIPEARVAAVRDVYPIKTEPRSFSMQVDKIERVLGIRYADEQICKALSWLEFQPTIEGIGEDRILTVTIPTYRRDVSIAEDVVEEVARVLGYESLPSTLPVGQSAPVKRDPMYQLRKSVRQILIAAGASEAITYVTVSAEDLEPFASDEGNTVGFLRSVSLTDLLRIRNPLQSGRNLLRPTLVPSLIESVASNLRHSDSVRLFELARVYLPNGRDELPTEIELATIAIAGRRDRFGLGSTNEQLDYFDLKGIVDELSDRLGLDVTYAAEQYPGLHPGRSARLTVGDTLIGRLGEVRPEVAKSYGVEDVRLVVAEIDLAVALSLQETERREVTVPRFLPVQQDFAVVVDESVSADAVQRALLDASGSLATGIALFDIFRGPQIGEGKKSLAFRVTFTAPDRALTDSELVKVRGRIEKVLKQRVNGVLRA